MHPASHLDQLPVLISSEEIAARVNELATAIEADYAGRPLTLVGVLKGAFVLLADLVRRLNIPLWIDFIEASSYGDGAQSSGAVKLIRDVSHDPAGRHVLMVEDIVDTGLTMNYLFELFRARGALSVEAASLLVRHGGARLQRPLRYSGFDLESEAFVVGYGMDYRGYFRNLPHIARLDRPADYDAM